MAFFRILTSPMHKLLINLKFERVPTIFLVSKDGTSAQRISEGMISADELKKHYYTCREGHESDR